MSDTTNVADHFFRTDLRMVRDNADILNGSVSQGSFSVVVLMKEDATLVHTFIDYYLDEGADSITIYFDGPSSVPRESLPSNVELIEVGPDDKKEIPSGDPGHRSGLQGILYLKEHSRKKTDWMLAVDADEFVTTGTEVRLGTFFKSLDLNLEAVRFPVAEAVWVAREDGNNPFSNTWFRIPLSRWQALIFSPLVYGHRVLLYRRGLIGHCAGKHAVRTSVMVDKITCHHSEYKGRKLGLWAGESEIAIASVAHFDAISFTRWKEKFGHRIEGRISMRGIGSSRARQVHTAVRAIKNRRVQPLFRSMYYLNSFQFTLLRLLGKVKRLPVAARLRTIFQGVENANSAQDTVCGSFMSRDK